MLPSLQSSSVTGNSGGCNAVIFSGGGEGYVLPLASKVEAVGTVVPEWHADTRDGIQMGESSNGVAATGLPQSNLSLAHLGETSRGESVVLAQPDCSAVLGTRVARRLMHRLLLTDIPNSNLLVSRRRHKQVTARVP